MTTLMSSGFRCSRWGEDGMGGICDDKRLCFALALWNERDPILKERLFGLTNSEANHGEDVKEYYFYLDSTPTHGMVLRNQDGVVLHIRSVSKGAKLQLGTSGLTIKMK
jgi:hypothetical protein